MRAEPAPCPPLTARNALVIAIVILSGSKPTTAPLRRMTLKWVKRGSAALPAASLAAPAIVSRSVVADGEAGAWAMRMTVSFRSRRLDQNLLHLVLQWNFGTK